MAIDDFKNRPAPESVAERIAFASNEDLIQYLESLGVDRSSLFELNGTLAFREKPMVGLNYYRTDPDNPGAPEGMMLTEWGIRIVAEIKNGVFKPRPRPDLVGPDVKLQIADDRWGFKQALKQNGEVFRPASTGEEDEEAEEMDQLCGEQRGTLIAQDGGYFLKLKDGSLLPFNKYAITDLNELGGGIERYIGTKLEVRVDDSVDPPIVTEIFFEGE